MAGKGTKGQVTPFIVIGLLLLIGALYLAYVTTRQPVVPKAPPQIASIHDALQSCFRNTADAALFELGLDGGWYGEPPNAIKISIFTDVPIYLSGAGLTFPSTTVFEQQLANVLIAEAEGCIRAGPWEEMGASVRERAPARVSVDIQQRSVIAYYEYPIEVEKNGVVHLLETFSFTVQRSYGFLIDQVRLFLEEHLEDYPFMCISCVTERAGALGYEFVAAPHDQYPDIVVFKFILPGERSPIDDYPLPFSFAVQYPTPEAFLQQARRAP